MNFATQKVGRITVALGLVAFGAALLVDNLSGTEGATSLVLRLWPIMLIGFGLEYLVRTLLAQRKEEPVTLRFDVGGAFLLVLVIVLSVGVNTFRSWSALDFSGFNFGIGAEQTHTESRTISAANAKALEAEVKAGSITVQQGGTAGEIRVDATYTAHGIITGGEEIRRKLESVQMAVTEGETIVLKTNIPSDVHNVTIRYEIYAPPGLKIKAHSGAGSVEVTGYQGDLELSSSAGRIRVDASSGSVTATNGAGRIDVKGFDGPVSARTSVGALDMQDVAGPLQLNSGTGSIYVNGFRGGKLVAETRTGGIHAEAGAPLDGDVRLKTSTGSINLTVPQESSMRVTAQTRTGSFNGPGFVAVSRSGPGSSGTGTSGEGKHTVNLEASTGSVHFNVR